MNGWWLLASGCFAAAAVAGRLFDHQDRNVNTCGALLALAAVCAVLAG